MQQVSGETSSGRRGGQGALAGKRAADSRALALLPAIREIAAGFVSRRALAGELNRRGIPTARGGSWRYTTVVRMLTRLGLLTSGKRGRINNGLAHKQAADSRAKALAPTIRALQGKGVVSPMSIARELNERGIPAARGGKWHLTAVTRLLERLERLESSSRTVVASDEIR
jgi:Recombinase